ncbi:MAG: energy-dependent translational throttle protein EttA [Candidatus Hydrogenedentota bacterium]
MTQAPTPVVLSVLAVTKVFGIQPILDSASFTVHEGDRIGLIGRNGTGKSTLMKLIAAMDVPDTGNITRKQGLRVAFVQQECPFPLDVSVGEILGGIVGEVQALLTRYHELADSIATVPHDSPEHDRMALEMSELHHTLDVTDAWHSTEQFNRIKNALKLPDSSRTIGTLSGGERRRVDLACALLKHPDLLLLDEPTNHIDVDSVQWMESFLATYEGSCILVTHDRYFLDRICTRIVELENAKLTAYPGNYGAYLERKALLEEQAAREEANRQAALRRELAWMQRQPKARATKAKAREDRFYEMEAAKPAKIKATSAFLTQEPERLGKTILDVEKISKSIAGKELFRDLSFKLHKGIRVGIVGPNGAGKTTLLRVLMGDDSTDKGKIVTGFNTAFIYVDQTHEDVPPDKTILDYVSGGAREIEVAGNKIYLPSYLERFLFDGSALRMAMGKLSGGERKRVDLAKKLLRGGNVLVLDEPTNDLDLQTLRVLEEFVAGFEGCGLIVSHDRYFLNRVCTHLIVFEGEGEVAWIVGAWDDYLLYKANRETRKQVERNTEPKQSVPVKDPDTNQPRKLTYQERKELGGMERSIESAESEVSRIETAISAPGFFQGDQTVVRETLAALETARKRVELLYSRWHELESLA